MNGALKIEKGVPIPEGSGRKGVLVSTFEAMKVGDSFLFPTKNRTQLALYAERAKVKIITRAADEENVRVWRVK